MRRDDLAVSHRLASDQNQCFRCDLTSGRLAGQFSSGTFPRFYLDHGLGWRLATTHLALMTGHVVGMLQPFL